MPQILKIQALFLSSALLMFGGGLQGLLLSVRGAQEGFSIFALGLIGTGWSVGFIAGSIMVPMLVRRVGHIRAYSVMAALGAITILLNLLWINDIGWIVLRVFSGFCFAGAAMIVESWLNEVSDNKGRGTIFSLYVMVNMSASTLGQLSMSITGIAGYLPFVIGALAFSSALLPTALTTRPQPRPLTSAKINLPLLYRTSPIAVIASFAIGIGNGTFGTLAPVYGYLQGLKPADIAQMMSIAIVMGALSQVPFGRLSDRVDRRWVIIGASVFASVTGLALVLVNPFGGWPLFVLFGLYGFASYPIYAVAIAHANDAAKDGDFASIAAGMLLTLGLGLAIGPLIGAYVMRIWQPVDLFLVTATFHAILAILAFVRMHMRPLDASEERSPFRPVQIGKNSTLASTILDPRADEASNQ
ncbi:Uncharacterized MFS-type transporter [hydrothermal vent metagenome]|uniref:Uncharacterized MFS-type transporter n=1 Tax=hydrothermal vent metagenome TaxID=652676 RepID=A0A3B0T6R2_9ZZZZ